MKRLAAALTIFGFAIGLLAVGNTAFADNAIMGDFTATYPATAGTPLASCSTCHTSVPSLNPYGSALRANGFNFSAIEGLDSDGDGVSNLQEIRNLTNPGVAQAAPTTTTTTAPSTTTTAPATTTTIASTTTTTAPGATSTTSTTRVSGPSPASTTTTTVDTTPSADAASGALPFNIGGVGTVWLAVEDGRLVIVEVETTWTYSQENEGDEIEVEFRSGETEVEFEAELEDGTIRTTVEFDDADNRRDDDDDDHDDDDHDDHDDDDDDDDDDHDDDDD